MLFVMSKDKSFRVGNQIIVIADIIPELFEHKDTNKNFIRVEYEETNDIEMLYYGLLFIEFDKTLIR